MASVKLRATSLDYAISNILEKKTNAISHPNIGSLRPATEEELI